MDHPPANWQVMSLDNSKSEYLDLQMQRRQLLIYPSLSHNDGPTALIPIRQNLPILKESGKDALKGAYIIKKEKGERPDIIIIGTGSEVHISLEAYDILQKEGIDARIVSMPSWEIFEEQEEEYKNEILPQDIEKRLAVEAGRTIGWERYVGIKGGIIGIDVWFLCLRYSSKRIWN